MEPMIRVQHLTKRYKKSSVAAVDDVSFDVEPGELFAFLGPNGAGKTTTISILTTTLSKTDGTVTIAGHDLDREATAVRRNIGIIFQNPSIDLHLSGEENIRLHVALYGTLRLPAGLPRSCPPSTASASSGWPRSSVWAASCTSRSRPSRAA